MRTKARLAELRRVRLIAADLIEAGKPPAGIATLLGVDDQSVRRWRRTPADRGRAGLASAKPGGRPRKLDPAELARDLPDLLAAGPRFFGYDAWPWTTRLVARLVGDWWGVAYAPDHVGVLLGEAGITRQKPACRAKGRDEGRIDRRRAEAWPAPGKKVPPGAARSCSPTRSGVLMTPCVKKTWAPAGRTPAVPFRNRHHKKGQLPGGDRQGGRRDPVGPGRLVPGPRTSARPRRPRSSGGCCGRSPGRSTWSGTTCRPTSPSRPRRWWPPTRG